MIYYQIIYDQLSTLDVWMLEQPRTPRSYVNRITKLINQLDLPAKIHSKIIYDKDDDNRISGNYFEDLDEENKSPIRLNWCFIDNLKFHANIDDWCLTKQTVSIIVCHEIIHCEQFRSRDFEFDSRILVPTEDYFSDLDEIQAYGFESAMEIKLTGDSPTKRLYLDKFKNHAKVLNEFFRWVYYYTKYA